MTLTLTRNNSKIKPYKVISIKIHINNLSNALKSSNNKENKKRI
jgi:hypothetical protein